jgi:tight adherence protein C
VVVETRARGGQWKRAMENMAFRNEIEQLTDVVSDILISYEKGTPITETLQKEAKMMRSIKNAQIQEEARRLNVKMLIPMAIFSFLPLLFLMLAPMLIQLMQGLM